MIGKVAGIKVAEDEGFDMRQINKRYKHFKR